jgi:hypothetical protein
MDADWALPYVRGKNQTATGGTVEWDVEDGVSARHRAFQRLV